LDNSGLEEFRNKWTRLSGLSSFIEWRREGWTLNISNGWDTRSVDTAIRAVLSPNAL
jgi:hypothetical protein